MGHETRIATLLFLVSGLVFCPRAGAVDVHDTRMLTQPAVSDTHVAFVYAEDLWVAKLDGTGVKRVTTHMGNESNPRFSPDGSMLAFSGQYDGNTDVYVVPVDGGEPRRLTWHPGEDVVQGFTPGGGAVLFRSRRNVHTPHHTQFFLVSPDGGMPERLPVPHAHKGAYSPDGSKIAYTPIADAFDQWKNYRGGTTSRIWIYDTGDHSFEEIPKPKGGCNDTDPMWIGDKVYFRSDRNGEFNLFVYDTATDNVRQLTAHRDFPVLNASAGGGRIVYDQAGYLRLFDPRTGEESRLTLGVSADLIEPRGRYAEGPEFIRNFSLSPSGARAAFEYRGEIVTVPREKGNHRNLTRSPGAHERSPAWSPDGSWIAYLSDSSGEYELHVASQDGKGETRVYNLDGAGFYEDLEWSPDGQKLSYTDNSHSLYVIDLDTKRARKISSEPLYSPIKSLHHSWSPDSRWIAYTQGTRSSLQRLFLYSVDRDRSHPVTEGLSDVSEPVFDDGGKYLYFFASTEAGPVRQWFAMSNADFQYTGSLYLAVLPRGVSSPLAKESDEEDTAGEAEDDDERANNGKNGDGERDDDGGEEVEVVVEFEDLSQRILALPVDAASYTSLQPGPPGQLFYLKNPEGMSLFNDETPSSLMRFDLKERKEESLLDDVTRYTLSADKKMVLASTAGSWVIAEAGGEIDPNKSRISTDDLQVRVDPRAEWEQMFHEAWRINRDYFYDPNMHGCDWPGMRRKYSEFLPHLAARSDLNRVLQWMCSELTVGHHFVAGGDDPLEANTVPGGLLGADFEVHEGRYRFAKVFGGLNWNPELRSPLTEPGVDAKTGEYLLAVEGKELRPPENVHRRLENTAEKIVEITIGPHADGKGSRTVPVVPIADEGGLRNRDWVEGNLKKVHDATGGRVAYVYVPNTTSRGHTYFKRYFFPQVDKDAIIIDERHNGGGQIADYYINILRRPHISYWAMRYGEDLDTPQGAIHGPKVMLIDETAGSGGDLLPWMFRKFNMGPLIGKKTWGGLVGILGFPELMDGGRISAPNIAMWTEDGWVVENEGVPPDIEVEQDPALLLAGRDPQLETAIEVILKELEASPPSKQPRRPPYPVRVRR